MSTSPVDLPQQFFTVNWSCLGVLAISRTELCDCLRVLGIRQATIPSHNSDGQLCRGYLRSRLDTRVPNSTAHCRGGAGWRVGKASNDRCAAQGLGRCSRQSLCRKQHCIPADQEACRHLARVGPFLLLSWIPGGHQRSSSLLLSAPPPLCSSSSYFSASLPPSQSIPMSSRSDKALPRCRFIVWTAIQLLLIRQLHRHG